jgi:ParB family chromosome partitioning protein
LFADLGKQDACTDPRCYQVKVQAHVAVTIAAKPKLVQISTAYRPAVEGSPILPRNKYTPIREDKPKDKEQAKRPEFKTRKHTTEAIVAEGEGQGSPAAREEDVFLPCTVPLFLPATAQVELPRTLHREVPNE